MRTHKKWIDCIPQLATLGREDVRRALRPCGSRGESHNGWFTLIVAVPMFAVALDLSLMVTALVIGGVQLWRRQPWGYIIAAIAGIQGALYLMVLSVNSIVAIERGTVQAPGELPVWGTLAVLTTIVVALLLSHVRGEQR